MNIEFLEEAQFELDETIEYYNNEVEEVLVMNSFKKC